jgi:hypothetical protein
MKAGRLVWGVFCITLINSLVDRLPEGREFSPLLFLFGAARHLQPEKHLDLLGEGRACPVVDDEASRPGPPVKLWSGGGQVLGGKVWYTEAGRLLTAISRKEIRLNVKSGNAWQMARSPIAGWSLACRAAACVTRCPMRKEFAVAMQKARLVLSLLLLLKVGLILGACGGSPAVTTGGVVTATPGMAVTVPPGVSPSTAP